MKGRLRGALFDSQGALRTGWRIALGAAAYAAAFYAVILLLGAGFGALFRAWNLTVSNLSYAPLWAQWIVSAHTGFTYGAAYLAGMTAGLCVMRRWGKGVPFRTGGWTAGLLAGVGLGAFVTALSLIPDCMRLEWPLGEPVLAWSMIGSALLTLLGKASGAALTKRILFDPIRLRYGRRWGIAAACLTGLILSGRFTNAVGALNAILMAWIGCEWYLRGGLWASAAFDGGWTVFTQILFADPVSSFASVYRLYHVSEAGWTGGNAGADCGLACTLGCAVILMILNWKFVRALPEKIRTGVNRASQRRKKQDNRSGN